jgi:hypothetical protein
MKASELRINNLVYYHIVDDLDERKEWDEVSTIDGSDIVLLALGDDPDYKPIPLTEETFNLFDTITDDNGDEYIQHPENENLRFYWHSDGYIQLCMSWCAPFANYRHITAVHLFQNLFRFTTGHELTLKK